MCAWYSDPACISGYRFHAAWSKFVRQVRLSSGNPANVQPGNPAANLDSEVGKLNQDNIDAEPVNEESIRAVQNNEANVAEKVVRASTNDSKVYIVVADVKDAFGSVVHSKLIEILEEIRRKLPNKLFVHQVSVQRKGRLVKEKGTVNPRYMLTL